MYLVTKLRRIGRTTFAQAALETTSVAKAVMIITSSTIASFGKLRRASRCWPIHSDSCDFVAASDKA